MSDLAQHRDAEVLISIERDQPDGDRVGITINERNVHGTWGIGGANVSRDTAGKLYALLGKFLGLTLVVLALVGCVGDDEPGLPDAEIVVDASPDAGEPDAAELPRCADVGCPDVGFCTMQGCCTCNVTGEPVQCLSRTADPDACEGN